MTQLKLIGAKLLQTLWEHTITLSGQLEQEKENVIFWNLKMLEWMEVFKSVALILAV